MLASDLAGDLAAFGLVILAAALLLVGLFQIPAWRRKEEPRATISSGPVEWTLEIIDDSITDEDADRIVEALAEMGRIRVIRR